jgi:hypothetical protein
MYQIFLKFPNVGNCGEVKEIQQKKGGRGPLSSQPAIKDDGLRLVSPPRKYQGLFKIIKG